MFNTTGEELFTYRGGCITQHYHTTNKIKHQNLSLVVSAFYTQHDVALFTSRQPIP